MIFKKLPKIHPSYYLLAAILLLLPVVTLLNRPFREEATKRNLEIMRRVLEEHGRDEQGQYPHPHSPPRGKGWEGIIILLKR